MKKNVVVLTGAGISAESGISTFRDAGGLWEGYDWREVASPEGWQKDKALVLRFYNERRQLLKKVKPNEGHKALVELEKHFNVTVITQNIDDLHERAGSSHIIHLHGELKKMRSTYDSSLIYDIEGDINIGDKCEKGSQLRPHIVWFKESVPMMDVAVPYLKSADYVLIVGTSMQVYPAAGLMDFAPYKTPIWYIDKNPAKVSSAIRIVAEAATTGIPKVVEELIAELEKK
jgi:NAD-dependent deacetylase